MILLKNLTIKNLLLTVLAAFTSAMSVLSILFGIAGNVLETPHTVYEWLMEADRYLSWRISGFGTLLALVSIVIGVCSVLLFFTVFLLSPNKGVYLKGLRLVTVTALFASFLLMIAGFIVSYDYTMFIFAGAPTSYLSGSYTAFTHIPFIINLISSAVFLAVNKMA